MSCFHVVMLSFDVELMDFLNKSDGGTDVGRSRDAIASKNEIGESPFQIAARLPKTRKEEFEERDSRHPPGCPSLLFG